MEPFEDHFDYSLSPNILPFQVLKVISYDIHNARVKAKNLRCKSRMNIHFELSLKNLDKDIISGEICYAEYVKKYNELTKSQNVDVKWAEHSHLCYVKEFANHMSFLLKK